MADDVIPPRSEHFIAPAPNAHGWNNVPVEVVITARDDDSGVAAIHYVLDGDEIVVTGDTARFRVEAEGIHRLEYWAVDAAGNEETPHNSVLIKLDFTPPVVFVESPEEGAEYLLRQPVEARWFAFDALSGIEAAEGTTPFFGEEDLTGDVGVCVFRVTAADMAGNASVVEVNYQVIYRVIPAGAGGTFIDKPLPEEGRKEVGGRPLLARYVRGEPIEISFALEDYYGEVVPDGFPTLTVTEVRFEGGRAKHVIRDWLGIPFDVERGIYRIAYPTAKRAPGIYDLWIGFGDGNHVRLRVEIAPRPPRG